MFGNFENSSLAHFGVQLHPIGANKLLEPPIRNVHLWTQIRHAKVLWQVAGQVQRTISTDHCLGRANVFEALIVTRHFLLDVGRCWPICQ